jgi:hypothetical protein
MTIHTLSEEEARLVNDGIAAERLLNDDTFQSAVNALSEQLSGAIINTSLEDAAKRERLYFMHSSLVELVNILKSRMLTKINIEKSLNTDEDDYVETEN